MTRLEGGMTGAQGDVIETQGEVTGRGDVVGTL